MWPDGVNTTSAVLIAAHRPAVRAQGSSAVRCVPCSAGAGLQRQNACITSLGIGIFAIPITNRRFLAEIDIMHHCRQSTLIVVKVNFEKWHKIKTIRSIRNRYINTNVYLYIVK